MATRDPRVSFDRVDFCHRELRLVGVDSMKLTPQDVGEIADALSEGFGTENRIRMAGHAYRLRK
jgi:hypothetical protein